MKKIIWRQCRTSMLLLLCGALGALPAMAQRNGQVKDNISGQPLPYANIQVQGRNGGTSADEQGRFSIPEADSAATLVISATGYEPLYTRLSNGDIFKLHLANIQLEEITINSNRKGTELKMGTYKKSAVQAHFSANGIPWILARYFPYNKTWQSTPFLKSLMIETRSEVKDALLNLRLYRKGEDGLPGTFLYGENIIVHAKKGKQNTVVDLAAYNIPMPEDGLYIGIEFLRIEQNQYKFTYTEAGSKKKNTKIQYAPAIGVLPSDKGEDAKVYMRGSWQPMWRNEDHFHNKNYEGKYNIFAMELTLTD